MGTRGGFGYRIEGIDKVGYNQYDSYPSVGGLTTLQNLQAGLSAGEGAFVQKVRDIRLVQGDTPPSEADIVHMAPWTDLNVSEQSTQDWYCLTRQTHGDTAAMLEAGIIEDRADFLTDSLFCEWAWIINCDDRTLEAYRGFQTRKHTKGRYATTKPKGWTPEYKNAEFYYGVALVTAWSWDALPDEATFTKFWQRRKAWF